MKVTRSVKYIFPFRGRSKRLDQPANSKASRNRKGKNVIYRAPPVIQLQLPLKSTVDDDESLVSDDDDDDDVAVSYGRSTSNKHNDESRLQGYAPAPNVRFHTSPPGQASEEEGTEHVDGQQCQDESERERIPEQDNHSRRKDKTAATSAALIRVVSWAHMIGDGCRWTKAQARQLAIAETELARCQKAWSSEQEVWLACIKVLNEEKEAHEDFLHNRAKQQDDEQQHFRKAWTRRRSSEGQTDEESDDGHRGKRRLGRFRKTW